MASQTDGGSNTPEWLNVISFSTLFTMVEENFEIRPSETLQNDSIVLVLVHSSPRFVDLEERR